MERTAMKVMPSQMKFNFFLFMVSWYPNEATRANMRWHEIKNSLLARVLLLLLASLIGYGVFAMGARVLILERESQELREKWLLLERQRAEYEAYLAELSTPQALEREAKARFNLKRPGEEVVVVVPERQEAAHSAPPNGFWERFSRFVSDIFR